MTEEVTAQLPRVSQKRQAGQCGWAAGGTGRGGRSVVWAMHLLPAGGPSGLGDLLAPGGAGWEPGGGALLRAEAVLVLQGERVEQHSQG